MPTTFQFVRRTLNKTFIFQLLIYVVCKHRITISFALGIQHIVYD